MLTNFDSFLGWLTFLSLHFARWPAVSAVTRSAEQELAGEGCKSIPTPGKKLKQLRGGGGMAA